VRIIRNLLVGFLAIMLVASVFGTVIGTGVSVEDDSLSEESVVEEDAVEIYDWYDLNATREDLSADYVLMNDLDEDTDGYDELVDTEDGWEPIGGFTGTLDGNEHEISDLYIDRPNTDHVGLFGYIGKGGEVRNVSVIDADVSGNENVGALVGKNFDTVSKSYATGIVSGTAEIGYTSVGTLVGYNDQGTVSQSYSRGDVSGVSVIGGLVGRNAGSVENSYATGDLSGEERVGGLVGRNTGSVETSYARGNMSGDSQVGGLVGRNYDTVSNSYATGNVSGGRYIGGSVGYNSGLVSQAYTTGYVRDTDEEYTSEGGLVGWNIGTVADSFWDIETSSIEETDGGIGKTTAEMVKEETFTDAGWDFDEDWDIIEEQTYPYFQWQEKDTYPYAPLSHFEVEIVDYDEEVEEGEEVMVQYEIENTGEVEDTQEIEFYVDDNLIETEDDVSLEAGEVHEGEFTWETEEGDTGDHELEVASEDDSEMFTVTVREEEEDDGIPGFTSTLLLLSVIFAVAIYGKKKRS